MSRRVNFHPGAADSIKTQLKKQGFRYKNEVDAELFERVRASILFLYMNLFITEAEMQKLLRRTGRKLHNAVEPIEVEE